MSRSHKLVFFTIVALIGVSLWLTFRRSPQKHSLDSRGLATEMMARDLAQRFPGSRALVISNPFAEKSGRRSAIQDVETAGIEGLKRGFGSQIEIEAVVFPDIHPAAAENPRAFRYPTTDTPLSYLIAEDSFDQLSQAHPSCDLIISLIGLPARLDKVKIWGQPGKPRFAFLLPDLRMLGSQTALREAVESEKLAAVVVEKPNPPSRKMPMTGTPEEEFALRYLLLNRTSLPGLLTEYEEMFDLYPPQ